MTKKYTSTLSKVTSEKRLKTLAVVDTESKAVYTRLSPRNITQALSDEKSQKAGKLHLNKKPSIIKPQPIINSQLQQANEYLASTKPSTQTKTGGVGKDIIRTKKQTTGTQRQLAKVLNN